MATDDDNAKKPDKGRARDRAAVARAHIERLERAVNDRMRGLERIVQRQHRMLDLLCNALHRQGIIDRERLLSHIDRDVH